MQNQVSHYAMQFRIYLACVESTRFISVSIKQSTEASVAGLPLLPILHVIHRTCSLGYEKHGKDATRPMEVMSKDLSYFITGMLRL